MTKRADSTAQLFPLAMSPTRGLGVIAGAVSLVVAIVVLAPTGRAVCILFAAATPTLAYLFGGAPRAVEVHQTSVVLRYWMRRSRTLSSDLLKVQQMADEMMLIHGTDTYCVEREHFAEGSFLECAEALRAIASDFVVRESRPRRRE